ncbi:hypothetical protein D9Q98_001166 [Chlorella vulgaris]|uniref:Cation/H+ exchanger transmembrane domain-containing protein n=1 Tax=Chlorella vulgaris TaxID=3077 RepID=A0A9D4TZP1_CHLVU|nr:hypothetical protein D9Q98_001166 [Chlorella vulgaris]
MDGEAAIALVPLIVCLALAILLGHLVHCRRIFFLTEASVSLLVGLFTGGAVLSYYALLKHDQIPAQLVEFNTQIFFDALLPPIIFNAGFSVKKKQFFRSFVTLVLFGVVGTMITAALIFAGTYRVLQSLGVGAHLVSDSLALGTIFSSSDSVATLQILDQESSPMLYSLVFGEGVVNDATSIVLLRAVQKISRKSELTGNTLMLVLLNFSRLFILSLSLGVVMGLVSAFLIRRAFVHHSTDREVSLVALLGFLAYMVAEELQLSGIFSIFFAGITMSHYTWHALSPSAKVVTVYLFRVISFTSELFLFLYAGFSMWSAELWKGEVYSRPYIIRSAGILAAALVSLVFVARAATLIPLTLLANTWRPPGARIGLREGATIWWAGSMRGAVTVAMAFQNFGREGKAEPVDNQVITVASNAAVIFITVVLGAVTSPLLAWLMPRGEGLTTQASTVMSLPSIQEGVSPPMLTSALQRHLHWNKRSTVYRAWQYIDQQYLYPLFGGRAPRGAGYRSPPPSPGKLVIHRVLGPGILKRLGPGQPRPLTMLGSEDGHCYSPVANQPGASSLQQPLMGRAGAAGADDAAAQPSAPAAPPKSGKRATFRSWPALSDAEHQPAAERGAAAAPLEAGAAVSQRALSQRSIGADTLETRPSSAVEELFKAGSGRLDSECSQQLDWQDSAQYGEAAWLAAGAPSDETPDASGSSEHPVPVPRGRHVGFEEGERGAAAAATAAPASSEGGTRARGIPPRPRGPPMLSRKSPFQTP